MTNADFQAWCARLRITPYRAAQLLGIGKSTAYSYYNGERRVPESIARLCAYIEQDPDKW